MAVTSDDYYDQRVLTADGSFKEKADLKVGDCLIDIDGQFIEVSKVTSKLSKEDVYKITPYFFDEELEDRSIYVTASQVIPVISMGKKIEAVEVTAEDLFNEVKKHSKRELYRLYQGGTIEQFQIAFRGMTKIPPYLVGVVIGAADIDSQTKTVEINANHISYPAYKQWIDFCETYIGPIQVRKEGTYAGLANAGIIDPVNGGLGLPDYYKYLHKVARAELVKGIIDATTEFGNSIKQGKIIRLNSKQITQDLLFIFRSLGFKAGAVYSDEGDNYYNLFWEKPDKGEKATVGFDIELIGKINKEMTAISIKSDNPYYLTEQFIVQKGKGK